MHVEKQHIFQPEPFRAAPWLPGPHGQTIAGRLLRRPAMPRFERVRLDTPDGDFVDLDFPPSPGPDAPLVLLLHGLEGSARRGYAILTYHELAKRGIASVGLNFRSCSGEPNRLPRFYHSGDTDDIRYVLDYLEKRFPGRRLGAIGFSLGGNALLKYLGEEAEAAAGRVNAAVAVSVPYDLGAGADLLNSSFMGRFYTNIFIRSLVEKTESKKHLLNGRFDVERMRRARSFRAFDDAVTAVLHGFDGADDYYRRSSSAQFVGRIRVPVLLIHAKDDPFVPADAFPHEAVSSNRHVHAALTENGGHVGFIEGTPLEPRFWAERQAARFLAAALMR